MILNDRLVLVKQRRAARTTGDVTTYLGEPRSTNIRSFSGSEADTINVIMKVISFSSIQS